MTHPKRQFMEAAIEEALRTKEKGDYAVGAVIVKGDDIIVKAGNRIKITNDSTQHAELIAIREASKILGTRYLKDCVLYTTHEPCPMCASATVWAMMKGTVAGAKIEDMAAYRVKTQSTTWLWRTIDISASEIFKKSDPKPFLIEEFMREECKKLFHS